MKILVFSDSHNHAYRIEEVVQRETDIDLIVHLGDCVSDIQSVQAKFPEYKYEFVSGNCDYSTEFPNEKIIEAGGKKILLTHSEKYQTQLTLNKLFSNTSKLGVDIVLFGHTHVPYEATVHGVHYINPGCVSRPKSSNLKTYAVLFIEGEKVTVKFKEIITPRR